MAARNRPTVDWRERDGGRLCAQPLRAHPGHLAHAWTLGPGFQRLGSAVERAVEEEASGLEGEDTRNGWVRVVNDHAEEQGELEDPAPAYGPILAQTLR